VRPALQALAEQQQVIDGLRKKATRQDQQIQYLTRGLQSLAQMAGVENKVSAAMLHRADSQNPAQPVPAPPAGPPVTTTPEAEAPEAFGDVTMPGMVPGSTNDVAADSTTTVYRPGEEIGAPAFHNLIDVTQPVDGTQNARPLSETKTLTDVRVGDPMNPQTAYPLQGEFQNAQRTSAREDTSRRTMASLRLAKLRIEAGTAASDNEYAVAGEIEKDASRDTGAIEAEIGTLESVKTAARQRTTGKNLVPRSTGKKAVASMQGTPHQGSAAPVNQEIEDSDLFG
jgi:hypothetical protein